MEELDPRVYRQAAQVLRENAWYPGEPDLPSLARRLSAQRHPAPEVELHCAATALDTALSEIRNGDSWANNKLFAEYCKYALDLWGINLALARWNDRHAANKEQVIALFENAASALEKNQTKPQGPQQTTLTAPADSTPAFEGLFTEATV